MSEPASIRSISRAIRPDWMRERSSRSSTIPWSRSQSSRAACMSSVCFSLSGPTVSSAARWTAIRSEVSGVRNSCATVATRSFLSSSNRMRRVTSWSTMVAPTTPPSSE